MKKTILVVLAVLSVLTSLACAAVVDESGDTGSLKPDEVFNYTDLAADWYRDAVSNFGYPGIFSEDTMFRPEQRITRMEYARLLRKALNIEFRYFAATDIRDYFDDVNNEDAGASALYDLVTAGVIDGGGSFRPNDSIERESMIHYAIRALDYVTNGSYAVPLMLPKPFADEATADEEYIDDINKAALLKLIFGRGNNMLFPKEAATRAEAVVFTERLVKLYESLMSGVKISASAFVESGSLKMALVIENTGSDEVTTNHNSGQKFDFKVLDEDGNILYTWSADKLFIQAVTTTTIEAGERVEFSAKIESDAYDPIRDKASIVKAFIVGTSEEFQINSDGYTAKIA